MLAEPTTLPPESEFWTKLILNRQTLVLLAAAIMGLVVWNLTPVTPLDENGMHFLATLLVAVILWVFEVFDEYIVGLLLLLFWVGLSIAPAKVALGGFSEDSWFFTIGALGLAVVLAKSSLLQRLSLRIVGWIPIRCQKAYYCFLLGAGVFAAPLLPSGKVRAVVAVPVSQALSDACGFAGKSNGAAALSLAAFVGFSEMCFMFLTGGTQNLLAWNFLPPQAKAEFGWLTWFVAMLPASLVVTVSMVLAVYFLLPLSENEKNMLRAKTSADSLAPIDPISRQEKVTLFILILTVAGWLTTSLHGLGEAWVALAALLMFLLNGTLTEKSFRNDLDWGLIVYFGVLNSLAVVAERLKVDRFLMLQGGQMLKGFAAEPLLFLLALFFFVAAVRFFIRKTPAAALITAALIPLSDATGIHAGLLVAVSIMVGECFLLSYQDGNYQIAFAGSGRAAFSHEQARKILAAKYLATLVAIVMSIPYWRWLGFIR